MANRRVNFLQSWPQSWGPNMGFGLPVLLWVLAFVVVLVGGILSSDLDGVIFSGLLALALSVLATLAGIAVYASLNH